MDLEQALGRGHRNLPQAHELSGGAQPGDSGLSGEVSAPFSGGPTPARKALQLTGFRTPQSHYTYLREFETIMKEMGTRTLAAITPAHIRMAGPAAERPVR